MHLVYLGENTIKKLLEECLNRALQEGREQVCGYRESTFLAEPTGSCEARAYSVDLPFEDSEESVRMESSEQRAEW